MFCIIYLFSALGWSFIFGFLVIVIGMYTNYKVAKQMGLLRKDYMKAQDARMNLTNEMLQNIKIIKMYAWEKIFLKLISEKRIDELKVLGKVWKFSTVSVTLLYLFPAIL